MNEEQERLVMEILQAIYKCLELIQYGSSDRIYDYLESIERRLERLEEINKS